MKRTDDELLNDIDVAIAAVRSHLARGSIDESIVRDAVAMRLLEIGESVKGLSPSTTSREPTVPWRSIAGMRDFLAHAYFAIEPSVLRQTGSSQRRVWVGRILGLAVCLRGLGASLPG